MLAKYRGLEVEHVEISIDWRGMPNRRVITFLFVALLSSPPLYTIIATVFCSLSATIYLGHAVAVCSQDHFWPHEFCQDESHMF